MTEIQIQVLVIEHRQQTADQISRLLGFESDLNVIGPASSIEEAVALMDVNKVEVILIGSLGDGSGVDMAAELLNVDPNVQIILLTVAPNTELMRLAMKAGFSDVVQTPPDSKTLYDAVQDAAEKYRRLKKQTDRLILRPEPEAPGPIGTIVAVHGAKGGAGCTTLATNLALKLHSQEKPSVLVDADLSHGDIPLFLNLQARNSIADLLPVEERGDTEMIYQVLLQHKTGLRVLAAPNLLDDVEISPDDFVAVLKRLRALYGWVIVDTGDLMVDPTLAVMQEADLILAVLTPDIASIRRQRIFFDALDVIGIPKDRITLVLNMAENNGITASRIEENLGSEIVAEIGYDRKAVLGSINRGEPLALNSKTKPFNKGLLELVAKVREMAVAAKEKHLESQDF